MNVADKIRRIYEQRPYPFGDGKALRRRTWSLDLDWVNTFGRDAGSVAPARVLVAGCGDGTEAFNLQRRLPRAEVVAVDFSARSIALAKRLQGKAGEMRRIRFLLADLADPGLVAKLGGKFDLVTCHGVLSYIPRTARVLKNFSRCLKQDGVLYLGVNGSTHINARLRQALPSFGFDLNEFSDTARLRDVLKLCDIALATDGMPQIAGMGPAYLAGDVFGALNLSLPLSKWILHGRRAGLYFRGNTASIRMFRHIAQGDCYGLLIPRSRGQVGDVLDRLSPSQFHRLLFSRSAEANPPWESRHRLLRWRIERSRLYVFKLPRARGRILDRLIRLTIASPATGLSTEWQMPEWELELLRQGDGSRSLASGLGGIPLLVPFVELRKQLYLLHQLGIITLRPPANPS